jgi:hypothetical protein
LEVFAGRASRKNPGLIETLFLAEPNSASIIPYESPHAYSTSERSIPLSRSAEALTVLTAKKLRKLKDLDGSFKALMKLQQHSNKESELRWHLELSNWFFANSKYPVAIEILNDLATEDLDGKISAKVTIIRELILHAYTCCVGIPQAGHCHGRLAQLF